MKRFFKVLFFACGWTGLLLNLIFVLVSITRDPAIETETHRGRPTCGKAYFRPVFRDR